MSADFLNLVIVTLYLLSKIILVEMDFLFECSDSAKFLSNFLILLHFEFSNFF